MRLSDIKGEKALDLLVDLIDPITLIMADERIVQTYKSNKPRIVLIKDLIAYHKKEVLVIFALLNGEDPETYSPSIIALPKMLLDLINDPELMDLFHLQNQMTGSESSGSAMESTEAQNEI
jgi:hypothetical protein